MIYRDDLESECLSLRAENKQLRDDLDILKVKYESLRAKKPFLVRCQELYLSYMCWRDDIVLSKVHIEVVR
jgi:hypothetical protein